jgi:predicted amidophosphoribosyltransferase
VRPASWGADLLDLLLPAGCAACGDWIPGGRAAPLVCPRCTTLLRAAPWPRCERCHHPRPTRAAPGPTCRECESWPAELGAARYAWVLRPPADDLVHALKYEGWRELAGPMGDAVARLIPPEADGAGSRMVVVPVPTTEERLRSRGYNQAELIARRVAEVRGLRLVPALRRVGSRGSQTSLAPDARRANVRGAFAPAPEGPDIRGASVLLVDDVLTTGATASEAATTLAGMGSASVMLLTYARALATGPEEAR